MQHSKNGWLAFSHAPNVGLATRVTTAYSRYVEKFGTTPNMAYVNTQFAEANQVEFDSLFLRLKEMDVQLVAMPAMKLNETWVGEAGHLVKADGAVVAEALTATVPDEPDEEATLVDVLATDISSVALRRTYEQVHELAQKNLTDWLKQGKLVDEAYDENLSLLCAMLGWTKKEYEAEMVTRYLEASQ